MVTSVLAHFAVFTPKMSVIHSRVHPRIRTPYPHACRLEGHQLYGERLETFSPGNLAAESRVQATEPQAGFHIALSSYRTEL